MDGIDGDTDPVEVHPGLAAVWPGSSDAAYMPFVIFAVGESLISQAQFYSWAQYQGLGVKPLYGSYKGAVERSFIMRGDQFHAHVAGSHWIDGQESVMFLGRAFRDGVLHGDRKATLMYLDKRPDEPIGAFGWLAPSEAKARDGWTYDPVLKEYFGLRV